MRISNCIRCGKENAEIHTCTPLIAWKGGFEHAIISIEKMLYLFEGEISNSHNSLTAEYALEAIMKRVKQIKLEHIGKGVTNDESTV